MYFSSKLVESIMSCTFQSLDEDLLNTGVLKFLSADDIERFHQTSKFCRQTVKSEDYEQLLWMSHWDIKEIFYPNGYLQTKKMIKDGMLASMTHWYNDGKIMGKSTFKNNKEDGINKNWWQCGKLLSECSYKEGEKNGLHRVWFSNGNLKSEFTYDNGKIFGTCKYWHENGKIQMECSYKNSKKNGIYRLWYPNGQLELETTYINGKLNGEYREWDAYGIIKSEKIYKDGIIGD